MEVKASSTWKRLLDIELLSVRGSLRSLRNVRQFLRDRESYEGSDLHITQRGSWDA